MCTIGKRLEVGEIACKGEFLLRLLLKNGAGREDVSASRAGNLIHQIQENSLPRLPPPLQKGFVGVARHLCPVWPSTKF
jgi:hypothetical protein